MDRMQLGDVASGQANAVRNSVAQGCEIGELIEFTHDIRRLFAKVTEAAATWDGTTDPVRHLLPPLANVALEGQQMFHRIARWFKERL